MTGGGLLAVGFILNSGLSDPVVSRFNLSDRHALSDMWLLTCEALFQGKRKWLRPGERHLFGRTAPGGEAQKNQTFIDDKRVSRKHLIITVGEVSEGSGSQLYTRSKIELQDTSKTGTTVNGEKINQQTRTLDGKECVIKLGNYESTIRLKWHTVVLSDVAIGRKQKWPLESLQMMLEKSDVKTSHEYVANETTHGVTTKRNTPGGLQALVQGRWLVTDAWVEALVNALTGTDLEEDFDGAWPAEKEFLVPPAGEPVKRPDELLEPNPARGEVFRDFVFIMFSSTQYRRLSPVVTCGGGKALLWETDGSHSIEDAVRYVKDVAGEKDDGGFAPSQQTSHGVVIIRTNGKDRSERLMAFMRGVDAALGQRSIETSELLDPILTLDTRDLRKQLEEENDEPGDASREQGARPTPAQAAAPARVEMQNRPDRLVSSTGLRSTGPEVGAAQGLTQNVPQAVSKQPSSRVNRKPRRYITESRFKGFDELDPSQVAPAGMQLSEPAEPSPEQEAKELENAARSKMPSTDSPSKKRAADAEMLDEEAMYDAIMPGFAAMKRRRLETAQSKQDEASVSKTVSAAVEANQQARARKKRKEMDVMAEIQARRQKEEEERRKDDEALKNQLAGIDISELKDLAKVEEMEIKPREGRPHRRDQNGLSDRWNPAWNGRRNFKKFRKPNALRPRQVIVTLEEVPRKGHGIGEEYWLQSSTSRSKSTSQSQSRPTEQDTARSQRADDEDEDATRFRGRLHRSRQEDEEVARAEELFPEEIAGDARDSSLQEALTDSTLSQTLRADSQRSARAGTKRPSGSHESGPTTKKARASRPAPRETVALDDGDDDDELKFRRRRR